MRLSLLNPQHQRALWGGYTPEGPPLLRLEIDVDIFIAKGKQLFSATAWKQMHACICFHWFEFGAGYGARAAARWVINSCCCCSSSCCCCCLCCSWGCVYEESHLRYCARLVWCVNIINIILIYSKEEQQNLQIFLRAQRPLKASAARKQLVRSSCCCTSCCILYYKTA